MEMAMAKAASHRCNLWSRSSYHNTQSRYRLCCPQHLWCSVLGPPPLIQGRKGQRVAPQTVLAAPQLREKAVGTERGRK